MMVCTVHMLTLTTKTCLSIIPLDIGHIYQNYHFPYGAYLMISESYIVIRSNELTSLDRLSLSYIIKSLVHTSIQNFS